MKKPSVSVGITRLITRRYHSYITRRYHCRYNAQVIGGTAIPILRKYIVTAAESVGADVLEFAVPELAEVVSGRKSFKTAAKSVGRQTLRKQLGSGSRKRTASKAIPTKSVNK